MRRWFREKYGLPPNDPRFLEITDLEILMDYEGHLAFTGEALKECPFCQTKTYQKECPVCASEGREVSLTGDTEMDKARALIEDGEDIDLNEYFGIKDDDFSPVEKETP